MGRGLWHSLSTSGILLGMLFFAASLTPTLLPRSFLTQGVLAGCSLAAGYGIGVFGRWLWAYMEVPPPKGRLLRIAKLAAATGCAVVAIIFLWQAAQWQNSIRELMQLEPVDTAHPVEVALIALAVFASLLVLARLFQLTLRFVARRVSRFLPRRCPTLSRSSRRLRCSGWSSAEFSSGSPCASRTRPSRNTTHCSNRRLGRRPTL